MTVETRVLPTPSSPLWNDPKIVLALAGVDQATVDYWSSVVSLEAHAAAHHFPAFGCPGCPPTADPGDRSAEVAWWKQVVA